MFDQKPTDPEDIFSDTEPAANGANIVTQGASTQLPPPITSRASFFAGKLVWIIFGAVILLVLVGGGLYLALRGGEEVPVATIPSPSTAIPEAPIAPPVVPTPAPSVPSSPSAATPQTDGVDTDRDGISDADEASYGTNPASPDTDSDELSDADEVRVYRTNPLAPDSDGDTYKDGQEVKGGYDPNGPGKLQDINRARAQ